MPVYFEPSTERLVVAGFEVPSSKYAHTVWNPEDLVTNARRRRELIEAVQSAHPETVTAYSAPHFLVHDERSASLNAVLAQETRAHSDRPVRAIPLAQRTYAVKDPAALAQVYAAAGISEVEVRLTPVGGENESLAKVRSVFTVVQAFSAAGITVTLGQSGNLGQVAVAHGYATNYSVGVGMLESVNHGAVMNRQISPPRPRSNDQDEDCCAPCLSETLVCPGFGGHG